MRQILNNELILASAGSGKTWQLTNRFIAIMAQQYLAKQDVRPERIIAITFTRKAAGEFFDSIITKLAQAATSQEEATKLSSASSYPILSELDTHDYLNLLEIFIKAMPKLFLGTLDSFFSQILRTFAAEFGLPNNFQMLNDADLLIQRRKIYQQIFETLDEAKASTFFASFRRAVAGAQKASIQRSFDEYIKSSHSIYLNASEEQIWGNPSSIWRDGNPWNFDKSALPHKINELFAYFESSEIKEKQQLFWNEFREQILSHTPGTPFPHRVKFFIGKFCEQWVDIQSGHTSFSVNRLKQDFDAKACELISEITRMVIGQELLARAIKTQGLWDLLHIYEQYYGNTIRRRGMLTFNDLEVLLRSDEANAQLLSQTPNEDQRLQIDYRLDSRFDHWLLDEFQDTSYSQWSILENLIDEAIQDNSGERSLFLVGDIKQAIYAWRGGDTQLFSDIYQRYQGQSTRKLQKGSLSTSWRSGHDVINPVNALFGDPAALKANGIPQAALEQWIWEDHQVALPHDQQEGYTAILGVNDDTEKLEGKFEVALELLKEIQPTQRGLSCVILVQKNKTGHALVDYIRQHSDIPIASEADVSIAVDNPVSIAFLSFFRWMAHPDDTFSWQHLLMTPMRENINEVEKETLFETLHAQLHEGGFESCILYIQEKLLDNVEIDAFSQSRLEELIALAQHMDTTGSRDIDEFLIVAENHKTREITSSVSVQVMTIHKAKGLTFDFVILPELDGDKLTKLRSDLGLKRNTDSKQIEWIYSLPTKQICTIDHELNEYIQEKEAEAAYESLCKFYVALTRARYANYLISDRKLTSKSQNFEALFMDVLAYSETKSIKIGDINTPLYFETEGATANPKWFEKYPLIHTEKASAQNTESTTSAKVVIAKQRLQRWSERTETETPIHHTAQTSTSSIAFGNLVHGMLEKIEWLDEHLDYSRLWKEHAHMPLFHKAREQILALFDSTVIRSFFTRPSTAHELLREQAFEAVIDETWASGVFDRVILLRNTQGEVTKCQLIDFKTTSQEILSDDIQKQMILYKSVLKKMYPKADIKGYIILTTQTKIIEC